MNRFQDFKDDLFYFSRAWELFLITLLACALALADLLRQYSTPALLLYTVTILGSLIGGLVLLCKGRTFRRTHAEAVQAEKRKEVKDRQFYGQIKLNFICSGLCFAVGLWCLIESTLTQRWITLGSIFVVWYWCLNCLIRGIFSVRYERQQHLAFLKEHPEYIEKK